MEPFVAYASPRVDAEQRSEYLRSWEWRLRATAADPEWHARLHTLTETAAANRAPDAEKAWAAKR
jgi:NAD(P)H dehydrogenase (quinone)